MFTGLTEGTGTVSSLQREGTGMRLEIELPPEMAAADTGAIAEPGDSIAINGSFFNTERMVSQYVTKAYFR